MNDLSASVIIHERSFAAGKFKAGRKWEPGKSSPGRKRGLFADGCGAAEAKRAKTQRTAAAFPTSGQGNGSAVRVPMTQPLISSVTGAQIDPGVPEWRRGEPP